MEGVMLKSERKIATAVRILKTGEIKVKVKRVTPTPRIFKLPFLRGVYILIDSLASGMSALVWSANQNLDGKEKINKKEIAFTLVVSLVLGFTIFAGIPYLVTRFLIGKGFWFGLVEGVIQASLFLGYIFVIGLSKDAKRIFQYHGAEHKIVHCYEHQEKVNLKNVKKYPTSHARCGTAFLFIVLVLAIIVFSFLSSGWLRMVWKLLLLPVIAGVSYEFLKLGDRFKGNKLMGILIWPGLKLQKMTTKEPTAKQIEVGIKAWEAVVR